MENEDSQAVPAWRTHLALILIIAAALFGIIQGLLHYQPETFFLAVTQDRTLPIDSAERTERALRCLFERLPSDEAVGFATDIADPKHVKRFRQVQYALAPHLVADTLDTRLVIGYFTNAEADYLLADPGYEPVISCSPEVTLYRRAVNQ
ncbi:MAG: hypothetical protein ACK2UW_15025 [Anaerolineales bacterium]